MNKALFLLSILVIGLLINSNAQAVVTETETQVEPAPATPTTSISKGLNLYVFPSANQDQATQDADEMDCYKWAMEQTGYDHLNPTKVDAAQANTAADGTAVRGAARGAAAGAAIGAIAGDAGQGAAIGATVGAMRGRRAKVAGDHAEQQQNNQAAAATNAEMLNDYKKAFSACMEGKGYTVK